VGEGKEVREFDGRHYILEESVQGDFSIAKAWKADRYGNLMFRKTARNFNPMAVTAGRVAVVEVEEIVEAGALDPDEIHLPGIYVDRLIQGTFEKNIEQRTVRSA
jgi:3-oxoacid CoA-transferase subunit A